MFFNVFVLLGFPAWRLMLVYRITVGFSPTLYTVDPLLLSSGNPFKYHEEVDGIRRYLILSRGRTMEHL